MEIATQPPLDFSAGAYEYQAKLQLAPVIDLVLFLIWFYLLVGQLVVNQKDAEVQLPSMTRAVAGKELPAEIVINLRQDGLITVAGQEVRGASLVELLQRELAKAKQEGQELRVVVRADRRQRFGLLDEVLRTCRSAGVEQVAFRAAEGGET
jgi:biopolymer transport protein ExbD